MQAESGTRQYIQQIARNNFSSLIDTWHASGAAEKARQCAELAVRQGIWGDPLQRDRDHVAGLTARPWHDPAQFWFVAFLEENFPQIQEEIRAALENVAGPVRPTIEDDWLVDTGSWQQAYLFREGQWQEEVCAHLPVTRAILTQVPELTTFSPGVILISRLTPGTHIAPHCGSTNAVLRVHLPILAPPRAWIRVADHTTTWQEGKCVVFDDSFEHEVRHEGDADRVVLILDMAHPDLDQAHRERLLTNRPSPHDRIAAFMREKGIEQVTVQNGQVVFRPNAETRALVFQYMRAAGVAGIEVDGDRVEWLPGPETE